MSLFGNGKSPKVVPNCEFEIKTNNSWFKTEKTPQAIIRNIPAPSSYRTTETFQSKGCKKIAPCIQIKDCVKITETDQTLELETKFDGFKIIPKTQLIEIQYF